MFPPIPHSIEAIGQVSSSAHHKSRNSFSEKRQAIGTSELHFLKLYINVVNPLRPFLSPQMLHDGLFYHTCPQQQALPSGNIVYVQIAAIWGAIAYGASLLRDGRADAYSDCARAALQHCFDELSPYTVRTYLLMESLATFTTCTC